MKVVIARDASRKTTELITAQFSNQWNCVIVPPDDLINHISDADVIIPEGAEIGVLILKQAASLKLIQTGAGYDNVDVKACTERGVWVANAAGINVFETEPLPESSPLRRMDNVILTPHTAGEPEGLFFHRRRFRFFAENVQRVMDGQVPENALNELPLSKTGPDRSIPAVILPEGYHGKILLVSVSGEGLDKTILLRSGDLWHREILRNTEAEIKNLGYEQAKIYELGGARVSFDADGTITIYGTSDEFGACDKEYAAMMIRKAYPENKVCVQH